MLNKNALLSLPADSFGRGFGNDPVGMGLLDLLEPVVHGIVFVVRYLRLVLRIVELGKVIELLYEFKILIALLVFICHGCEEI